MHDKPLSMLAGHLLHRRAGASRPAPQRAAPDTFGLDEDKVLRFAEGRLDPAAESRLAEEVAEILPMGWSDSMRAKERLHMVTEHLGGEAPLLAWLDGHPGLPRLTARLVALTGTLDRCSESTDLVDAVRSWRAEGSLPAGLRDVLPPETDEETLCDIGYRIDELLTERRPQDARQLALVTTEWLQDVARQHADPPSEVREAGELMAHLHQEISGAGVAA